MPVEAPMQHSHLASGAEDRVQLEQSFFRSHRSDVRPAEVIRSTQRTQRMALEELQRLAYWRSGAAP